MPFPTGAEGAEVEGAEVVGAEVSNPLELQRMTSFLIRNFTFLSAEVRNVKTMSLRGQKRTLRHCLTTALLQHIKENFGRYGGWDFL